MKKKHDAGDAVKPTIIDLTAEDVIETAAQPDAALHHDETPAAENNPSQDTGTSDASFAPPPSASRRSGNGKLLGGALAVAALVLGAGGGAWVYRDFLSGYFPTNEMTALIGKTKAMEEANALQLEKMQGLERLATQLKTDVDAIEHKASTAVNDIQEASRSLAGTNQRIETVESGLKDAADKLAEVKTAVDKIGIASTSGSNGNVADGSQALAALVVRIENLEKDVASLKEEAGKPADTALISQGLSDLKAKIAAGTGFAPELERIRRMVPAAAGLDVLEAHAIAGLPDGKGLAQELQSLVAALPKPEAPNTATSADSLWSRALAMLSRLVTIRVAGEADWPKAAEAAAALADSGDLPQAIEYLGKVEGARPQALQQWLDRAAARLKVETSLQSVEEAVLRVIAARG